MRILILTMLVILSVQSNAIENFLGNPITKSSTTKELYSMKGLKRVLNSNKVACFTYKRKVYPSKGYLKKYGQTKEFCSTARAKIDGVLRINKNNLTSQAFKQLLKK